MKIDTNISGKVTFVRPVMGVLNEEILWGLYTQRTGGEPVTTGLNPKKLSNDALEGGAKEVRHDYDLKLAERYF
jgi:hypothetical protein